MRTLVGLDHPALRTPSRALTHEEILSSPIRELIANMKAVLNDEKFGVAIAAPQVGEDVQIFIVAGHVLANRHGEDYDPNVHLDHVYINPTITKSSKKMVIGDEGCLSVPGKYGAKVERSEKVTLRYLDETGATHERGASGFLARIFQHEVDHLNGTLYIDHALEVIDVDENLKPL